MVLSYQSQIMTRRLLPDMIAFLSRAGEVDGLRSGQLLSVLFRVMSALLPVLAAAMFAGAAAVLLQTNFLLHLDGLRPKISRVSPMAGLKRMFGFNGVVEIIKSLGKLAALGTAIWIAIKDDWLPLVYLLRQDPHGLLSAVGRPMYHLFIAGVCTQATIASADLLWVR